MPDFPKKNCVKLRTFWSVGGHALGAPPPTGNNFGTWSVPLDGEAEGEESLLIGLSREKTFVKQNMMLEWGKMSQISPFYPESAVRGIKQTDSKT